MATKNLDHEALLRKYIAYVVDREGADFIEDGYHGYRGDTAFTSEEWAELERLAAESAVERQAGRYLRARGEETT